MPSDQFALRNGVTFLSRSNLQACEVTVSGYLNESMLATLTFKSANQTSARKVLRR